jgi:hypothetical protein
VEKLGTNAGLLWTVPTANAWQRPASRANTWGCSNILQRRASRPCFAWKQYQWFLPCWILMQFKLKFCWKKLFTILWPVLYSKETLHITIKATIKVTFNLLWLHQRVIKCAFTSYLHKAIAYYSLKIFLPKASTLIAQHEYYQCISSG